MRIHQTDLHSKCYLIIFIISSLAGYVRAIRLQ